MGKEKRVSINIVSWNSLKYLPKCLEGVQKQDYPYIDVNIIDNASIDSTIEWIIENYPEYKLIRLNKNYGFSIAHNIGIIESDGDYVLPLNPDVYLTPNFISNLINILEKRENKNIGSATGKLYSIENFEQLEHLPKEKYLDSTGLFFNHKRLAQDRGKGEIDKGQYDNKDEIFCPSGAAPLYRREMLEQIRFGEREYFDEDFFAYWEDIDLGWRAQLKGWRSIFVANSIAYHIRGSAGRIRKRRIKVSSVQIHSLKNKYLSILKNDTLSNFLKDLPFILSYEIPKQSFLFLFYPDLIRWIGDFFHLWRQMRKKRKIIQSDLKISDSTLHQYMYLENNR